MAKRLTLALAVLFFVITGALPVLSMLFRSIYIDGHFGLESYRGLMSSSHQWLLMRNSLALSSLVTLLTVAAGVPLGILLGKTDLPYRRLLTLLFVIPLLIPAYIIAVSWSGLLGHWETAGRWLFGLPGCVLVLFSVFLPVPMLLTMVFLRTINPELEQAGRLVSNWRGVLRGITLPLILPGIGLAALLVFVLSFGEFGVPNFLRFAVYPVESFTQFAAFYNFRAATAAALPLAAVTLILLWLEASWLRDKTWRVRPVAGAGRAPLIELGSHRLWLFVVVVCGALVFAVIPIVVLLFQSTGAYAEAFSRAGASLLRSLAYSAFGASLLVVLGFLIGYLVYTQPNRYGRAVDSLTFFLFALPGTVIGIGLISLWNTPWTNLVYATPLIILFGYLAKYTALTSRITVSQLAQISPSMEQAAEIAGAGWFRRMLFIVAPLAWRGLLAGWLVAYIFTLRDTGITMLVYPPGHETLPVRIFTLMANGTPQLIAALCVIMIVATLLPAGLLWSLLIRKNPGVGR
ncbi:MAG: hypothetical protein DSZ33_01795 [Gammaproteobacteria bacterium]|nr:MAG: hypothetical protein DSZ33_01795 [Gammaproteobacteria bacterium]